MADGSWSVVWITGGSSGIGRELARQLDGVVGHVAVTARSADKLGELSAASRTVFAYPGDVTDADAMAGCVDEIESRAGPVDLAILNAGAWALMDATDLDLAAVRTGVEVNYLGVMNALDALIPKMMARGKGHIAIVASVAGYRGLPRSVAYGPTKAALNNLAETLKLELEPHGITVSVINPGFVDTPMTADNPFPMPGIISAKDAAERILKGLRRGRFEIAFPTGFILAMKLLRLLPDAVYFPLVRKFAVRGRG
ncbi:SDR family NAD(P)-dependent oxidoreductase [Breoghania sp.]|uniref:SDR family NAD(P)-dependent oxidoreductase n=1 Tax=Breoghania sp. TaxID=2065378 RepID=UPI0029CA6BA0|nr:SDR family NAD(P)-dependent oxidoreductase [Breoghania sp.]